MAVTLGRTYELSLMVRHAQWCLDTDKGSRAAAAARRFAAHGVDLFGAEIDAADSRLLLS